MSSEQSTDTTNESQKKQQGIDIRQALDILSARASCSSSHAMHSHDDSAACHEHVPEQAKQMGQTIDLMMSNSNEEQKSEKNETPTRTVGAQEESASQSLEETRKQVEDARRERQVQIREKLRTMSVEELLKAVMEAQTERVATYRNYDSGLETVLQTGNMTEYPTICAKATASFSVLSDTINAILSVLADVYKRHDLTTLLTQLQQHEKEKLNTTAALHLERIREHNQELQVEGDERVSRLLREGVTSLKQRVASCVEAINEVLEEIRYALLAEEE